MKKIISLILVLCMLVPFAEIASGVFAAKGDYMLQDFSTYTNLSPADQSGAAFAHPVTSLTTEYRQTGTALRSDWESSGSLRAGVNTFRPADAWVSDAFRNQSENYTYLRFFIANPDTQIIRLTVRVFEGSSNKAYFRPSQATLTDLEGNEVFYHTSNAANHGTGSSMDVPAGFVGFVAYPIRSDATKGAGSGRTPVSDFADIHTLEIDVRTPENVFSGDFYVIDDICFTDDVTGEVEPREEVKPFEPSVKTDDLLMLKDFEDSSELKVFDQTHAYYALPVMSSTTEHTDTGKGFQANWVSNGNLRIGVHTYRPDDSWVSEGFAKYADEYTYLRLWISNPSFSSLHLTVRLFEGESNKAHFIATMAELYRKDGTPITIESGDAGKFGADSSLVIPSGFEGWVSYVIATDATAGSNTGRKPIANFADVHTIDIDVRRTEAETKGDYYVLDDICLTNHPLGRLQSTDEEVENEIPPIDTTFDGIQNVIFIIGDGMGVNQLEAARRKLSMALPVDGFPISGTMTTHNALGELTDSAAGGTALSTGYKTLNGMVARDSNGNPLPTLLEFFEARGKATGMITTSYLADATPATFGSHVYNRGSYTAIIKSYYENGIDLLLGGGTDEFGAKVLNPVTKQSESLIEYSRSYGYTYVSDAASLDAVTDGPVLGVFAPHYMAYENNRTASQPSIAAMTKKALELLSDDEDGFFLMVEGGNIDHACHANQLTETIADTIALMKAVEEALAFFKSHPDTLIVVTADHETGGLTASGNGFAFTTSDHSPADVTYFAIGKGAEYLATVSDNVDLPRAIKKAVDELDPTYGEGGIKLPTLPAEKFDKGTIAEMGQNAYTVDSESYSAFVSSRESGESEHDLRVVIAADLATLNAYAAKNSDMFFTVSFYDAAGNFLRKTTLCLIDDVKVYYSVMGAGNTYIAAEGCALFGCVITDVPDEAWASMTVSLSRSRLEDTAIVSGIVTAGQLIG